ncbi:MAG: helix-turn-helix domain-containing protein [Actinobacteria bacterium]|nr:helix-turn-helix domain-containing protein [Actinomycetota bacterium]
MQTPTGASGNHSTFRIYSAKSLGTAIGHYRRELGLSQAELADLVGLNRTYLSDLERGRQTEQVRRILRLLNQLGVRMVLEKAGW